MINEPPFSICRFYRGGHF